MSDAAAEEVLDYWFGEIRDGLCVSSRSDLWYGGGDELDAEIRTRFLPLIEAARTGDLATWLASPRGQLAFIIVLDQFTRNAFRRQAEAFASDDLALDVALTGIDSGDDEALEIVERAFYYHPLQHAESIEVQEQSVTVNERLLAAATTDAQRTFAGNSVRYAKEHRDIVARFGRFPYRNVILGRESTADEREWLDGGGKTFGQ